MNLLSGFRYLTFLLLQFCLFSVSAQSVQEIENSGKYYYGTGIGTTHQEALKNAQDALIGSISVHVSSEFVQLVKEQNNELSIYTEAVVKTYSTAVLHEMQNRLLEEKRNYYKVFVFTPKSNVEKVFTDRQQKVKDLTQTGLKAEEELRIGEALRNYYWALVLLQTLPDYNSVRFAMNGKTENALIFSLPDRIDQVFTLLKPEVRKVIADEAKQQNNLELFFTYRNKPIQNLDFIFFTGDGYSANHNIRDGRSLVQLSGAAAQEINSLRIIVEYQYRNKALLEPEVKLMLESTKLPSFHASVFNIPVSNPVTQQTPAEPVFVTDQLKGNLEKVSATFEVSRYHEVIRSITQAIRTGNHEPTEAYFTPEGLEVYNMLIMNGKVKLLEQTAPLHITAVGQETMVRSVPMMFSFSNNTQSFVENVVFVFNDKGLINNISFALSDIAVSDIVNRNEDWGTTEEKYYLIRFMEDYKTAYSLKRLDYIESIFAENALIIVGRMLHRREPIDMAGIGSRLSEEQIEYIRLSKSEYMERLKNVFARNEFVNIHFEDNQIRRTTKPGEKIYGIQIAQHYYSSTYADKGYLFLMIDLNDTLNPKIYVRTWQPEKNEDGSIFGPEDFRF